MTKNKNILGILLVLPVVVWLLVIAHYSVDVPWYDDFDPFPDFLRQWIHSESLGEQLALLLQPNNEHRMVIGKLVVLLYYWLTGTLSFTFIHFAGAAFSLGTAYLFWRSFSTMKLKWWYFLPVVLLLFQLEHHLVYLWAICSLQHQPVVFFLCLSMFLLSKDRLLWAIGAAVCANYAMSNGIFVWVAGGAVLFLKSDYKKLSFWVLAGVISISLYFHGLTTMGNEASIAYLKQFPHLSVLGFFAFLGGLFDLFPNQPIQIRTALPVLMGLLIMLWVVRWIWGIFMIWLNKQKNKRAPGGDEGSITYFLLGIMVFLLVNALVIGLLRPRFGFFVMVVSNYKLYPALFLCVAYLSVLSGQLALRWRQWGMVVGFLLSVIIWSLSGYSYLPEISERSKYLNVNAWNQQHNGFGLGHVPYSDGAAYVDTLMKGMIEEGVYTYPASIDRVANAVGRVQGAIPKDLGVQVSVANDEIVILEPNQTYDLSKNHGQYVFLQNDTHRFLYKMNQNLYTGRNIFRIYDKGVHLILSMKDIKPGTYQIGYLDLHGSQAEGGVIETIQVP
ncbi:hypothetical protein CLV98_108108 [Dyadobacter jejuensis]|uniref:4-amino-4-deoxy-L-arabinose transferase-like glycosyltransferase n=1 Tax=Dyadobacter jejuensis TaxID=1082580 RepID=A0A316AIT8_9BACT|nr:hypothetical protein CLV98_108108 [Dyadobacter jejuensis]